jgi:hypothetical protein
VKKEGGKIEEGRNLEQRRKEQSDERSRSK